MKTNKAMKRLYPWLIMRNVWNDEVIDSDDDTIELDLMPKGWRYAFGDEMCEEIDKVLKKANYQNDYRILEIKEKYGSLRWYTNSIPEKIFKEHDKIIQKYEKLSEHTCIICGENGKMTNHGWLMPLCKDCEDELY